MKKYHDISEVKDEQLRALCDNLQVGCFMIIVQLPDGHIEPVIMHRFVRNMSCMVAKESLFSLQMRYLTADEQKLCATTEDFQTKPQLRKASSDEEWPNNN